MNNQPKMRSPDAASLSSADDRVRLSHWLPPQSGTMPKIRIGQRWINVLWLLPIGFVMLVAAVALAQGLRELSAVQDFLPMGLCYPGRLPSGGDARPRSECAPLWRGRLLAHMPNLRLTLLVGAYAQAGALGPGKMTERVMAVRDHLPTVFPLPHPSWRSQHWAARNPWFDAEVLPALREAVRDALA